MSLPDDLSTLLGGLDPITPFVVWCTWCNAAEADGTLGVEVAPGEWTEYGICPKCLDRLRNSQVTWVDSPDSL